MYSAARNAPRLGRPVRTREQILASRWIKPFAHRLAHPSLWHINRRSLSKALGLGLFAGFIVPIGQVPLAAALAIPTRANVPAAVGATFVTNPFTFGPIIFAEYQVGGAVLDRLGLGGGVSEFLAGSYAGEALGIAGPFLVGMIIMALAAGILGYGLARLWMSARLALRWRARRPSGAPRVMIETRTR